MGRKSTNKSSVRSRTDSRPSPSGLSTKPESPLLTEIDLEATKEKQEQQKRGASSSQIGGSVVNPRSSPSAFVLPTVKTSPFFGVTPIPTTTMRTSHHPSYDKDSQKKRWWLFLFFLVPIISISFGGGGGGFHQALTNTNLMHPQDTASFNSKGIALLDSDVVEVQKRTGPLQGLANRFGLGGGDRKVKGEEVSLPAVSKSTMQIAAALTPFLSSPSSSSVPQQQAQISSPRLIKRNSPGQVLPKLILHFMGLGGRL